MNMTRKPGRPVDRNLQMRRREEILDAAARLFAAHGYAGADTQELADGLGIAKGTLFRYFPTKRELFISCIERAMERLRARVDAAALGSADPLEKLRLAIRAYLRFFDESPEVVELMILERAELKDHKATYFDRRGRRRESEHGWRKVVAELVATGRFRRLSPDRILRFVGDLLYGTIFSSHLSGRARSLSSQAREVFEFVRYALSVGPVGPTRASRPAGTGAGHVATADRRRRSR